MKIAGILMLVMTLSGLPQEPAGAGQGSGPSYWDQVKNSIGRHLGRPYVWGSSGLKSYDCSGFIWRVMFENGMLLKRTTARKFYLTLQKTSTAEQWQGGTLVFFDNLKHVGIVNSSSDFFHAQVSRGTNLSGFDPYWRPKICGFRKMPGGTP